MIGYTQFYILKNIIVIDLPSNRPSTTRRSFANRLLSKKAPLRRPEMKTVGKNKLRNLLFNAGQTFRAMLSGADANHQELLDDIETSLLQADVGIETTQKILKKIKVNLTLAELSDEGRLKRELRSILVDLLAGCEKPILAIGSDNPAVILVVGVNGVGKTTTIGKLAVRFKDEGISVLLAAGDTFRAAAIEQLQAWGDRYAIPVLAHNKGSDSASVIFDALHSAHAKEIDLVIADTAGRLHNKTNLMDELAKITRVVKKLDSQAPHEVLLVLDASTGQNALAQVRKFCAAVDVTGIILTKLDGTAKGGIIFALADHFGIPIRFIGVGEGVEDIHEFSTLEFVDALLNIEDSEESQ